MKVFVALAVVVLLASANGNIFDTVKSLTQRVTAPFKNLMPPMPMNNAAAQYIQASRLTAPAPAPLAKPAAPAPVPMAPQNAFQYPAPQPMYNPYTPPQGGFPQSMPPQYSPYAPGSNQFASYPPQPQYPFYPQEQFYGPAPVPAQFQQPAPGQYQQSAPAYYEQPAPADHQELAPRPALQPAQEAHASEPEAHEKEESHSAGGHHFGYSDEDGPETWARDNPECGGTEQSPIDINEGVAQQGAYPTPLQRINYFVSPESMNVTNNGHTIQFSAVWKDGQTPKVTGGSLGNDVYEYVQCHMHWGQNNGEGSEHTVNGYRFPMEAHFVHYNLKYGNYNEAIKHKDGLAVMGYFFTVSDRRNTMVDRFIQESKKVEGSRTETAQMENLPIGTFVPQGQNSKYATYRGSLTTPPCSEIATWNLSMEPESISDDQMQQLRSMVKDSHENDIHNYRPIQPLNNRALIIY